MIKCMEDTDSLKVSQNPDGSFSFEWDKADPVWSFLNDMTEEEVTEFIHKAIDDMLQSEGHDLNITNTTEQ